jgi:predicted RNA binding protein YcfA (HicA-like mRNA interferase family)
MPPKIRTLIRELKAAGFKYHAAKGSHRKFVHPRGAKIWMSGKNSTDAHHYQVRQVQYAIAVVKNEEK